MRPYGTSQQVAGRRRRALGLLRHGQPPIQGAQRTGVTAQSVRRWRRDAKRPRSKRQPPRRAPGRPSRLSMAQRRRLLQALTRGAYAYGYAEDSWTLDRIAHLIWDLFRVRYRASGVWYLLRRLDWSCQKPQRRSLARDDEAIAHWKHHVWPHIKKWHELGATLVFLDESGYSAVSPLKRTWAPRGQTPTVRTRLEHNAHVNLMGALCVTPRKRKIKLHVQSHDQSTSGEQVIIFLRHLLQATRGPIVLVWDKHPIHNRGKVKVFLAQHPRLQAYPFPTRAPELNPTEGVWTPISEYTASTAPHDERELRLNVFAAIARTRRSQKPLWACMFAPDLPWER